MFLSAVRVVCGGGGYLTTQLEPQRMKALTQSCEERLLPRHPGGVEICPGEEGYPPLKSAGSSCQTLKPWLPASGRRRFQRL